MASSDIKSHAQSRFAQYAQGYVTASGFASGSDLDRLLELAQPQPHWHALDIATGGGHTALKFAPFVQHVVASDLTLPMLHAARQFITAQSVTNLSFTAADAENLPFATAAFDLVTCRIAPHHFPDCFRFVQEAARVLKPGGRLLIEDQLVPEDDRAARYIDSFERLRDPSHHRIYAAYEWQGMFLDAGLEVLHTESISRSLGKLVTWAERQGCSPRTIERLHILLAQSPAAVREWLQPQAVASPDAAFSNHYIIIMGQKPLE